MAKKMSQQGLWKMYESMGQAFGQQGSVKAGVTRNQTASGSDFIDLLRTGHLDGVQLCNTLTVVQLSNLSTAVARHNTIRDVGKQPWAI